MKNFLRLFGNQQGFSTVMAIVAVVAASLAIAGLMPMISQAMRANVNNKEHLQAAYAAQAGVKRVVAEFEKNSNVEAMNHWLNREIVLDDDPKVTYKVEPGDGPKPVPGGKAYYFTSIGKVESVFGGIGAVEKKIENIEIIIKDANAGPESDVFDKYTLYAAGALQLAGSQTHVTGNVAALGDTISNSQWNHININGQYYALEEQKEHMYLDGVKENQVIFEPKLSTFRVEIDQNPAKPIVDPDKILDGKETVRLPGGAVLNVQGFYKEPGNVNLYGKKISLQGDTILQVDGNLNLNNAAAIEGEAYDLTLIVKGKMDMSGQAKIKAKNLKIYAAGDINYNSDASVEGESIVIQTEGKLDFTNRSAINANLFTGETIFDAAKSKVELYGRRMNFDNKVAVNGANVKIHATDHFETSNVFTINQDLKTYLDAHSAEALDVIVEIYSDHTFEAHNGWVVNAHDCLLQSEGNMELNGQLQINGYIDGRAADDKNAMVNSIARLQSHADIDLIGGRMTIAAGTPEQNNAGLVLAKGKANVQNYIDAPNVLLIADDTIVANGQAWFAGIYTNGNLDMSWVTNCHINENSVKDHLMKVLSGKGYLPMFGDYNDGSSEGDADIEFTWPNTEIKKS